MKRLAILALLLTAPALAQQPGDLGVKLPCENQAFIGTDAPAPGGPFSDCGFGALPFRAPIPTELPWHFDAAYGPNMAGRPMCVFPFSPSGYWANAGQPEWQQEKYRLPGSDLTTHWCAQDVNELAFDGQRINLWICDGSEVGEVIWTSSTRDLQINGACASEVICESGYAEDINGDCRYVPEPGLVMASAFGVLMLANWRQRP